MLVTQKVYLLMLIYFYIEIEDLQNEISNMELKIKQSQNDLEEIVSKGKKEDHEKAE